MIEEVRGVFKPFYVVCDLKNSKKQLHKNLNDAVDELVEARKLCPAGILLIESFSTKFIVPINKNLADDNARKNRKAEVFTIG